MWWWFCVCGAWGGGRGGETHHTVPKSSGVHHSHGQLYRAPPTGGLSQGEGGDVTNKLTPIYCAEVKPALCFCFPCCVFRSTLSGSTTLRMRPMRHSRTCTTTRMVRSKFKSHPLHHLTHLSPFPCPPLLFGISLSFSVFLPSSLSRFFVCCSFNFLRFLFLLWCLALLVRRDCRLLCRVLGKSRIPLQRQQWRDWLRVAE